METRAIEWTKGREGGEPWLKKYLIRFAQIREDFRLDELRAICLTVGIEFPEEDVVSYSTQV